MVSNLLALLAAICCSGFIAVFAYVHVVRRDLSPMQHSLSTYLTDPTRKTLAIGYALLAFAFISQGIVRAIVPSSSSLSALDAAMSIAAGVLLAPVALTSRRSTTGDERRSQSSVLVHRYSAWSAYLLAISAMACATLGSLDQPGPSHIVFGVLTAFAIALFAATARGSVACYGLWQKLLVMDIVAWLCFEAASSLTAG
jgi:hypothetical protein